MLAKFKNIGMSKENIKKFILVAIASEIIYYIWIFRGTLYSPLVEAFGLTNAQFGTLFTVTGLIATFGAPIGGIIMDRFSMKKLFTFDLLSVGILGLVIMIFQPSYPIMLLIFVFFGFSCEVLFWSGVLKSVRTLAPENMQGRAFGALEFIRGIIDLVLVSLGIYVFNLMGETVMGVRVMVSFYSVLMIITAGLIWFKTTDEDFLKEDYNAVTKKERNKATLEGTLYVLKQPAVWFVGLTAMCVYLVYCGIFYFVPFLEASLGMTVLVAAIFGFFNSSGMRVVASPISGFMADKVFKSSSKLLSIGLVLAVVGLVSTILLIGTSVNTMLIIVLLISVSFSVYIMRGVYYAPIGELNIPKSCSGAAMGVAAFLGYSPAFWAYALFGSFIDNYGVDAYPMIFKIMLGFAIAGIVFGTLTYNIMRKNRNKMETEAETQNV